MSGVGRARMLAVVAAVGLVVIAVLLAALQGPDRVMPGFVSLFAGIAGTPTALAATARLMTPILLVAVSATISARAGLFDVGQVGQYVIGGLAAATAGTLLPGPGPVIAAASLLIGAAAGGVWAWIIGRLAAATQVQLVVLTLIANYFGDGLVRFLTRTLLQDPSAYSIVATRFIRRDAWLPVLIPRTSLHVGFILALMVATAVWATVRFTAAGHRLTMYGQNPRFAALVGVNPARYPLRVLLVSGAIAGFAGGVEVFGVYHRYQDGTLGGANSIAWTGLTAAILVPSGLLVTVPVAVYLAALSTGLSGVQRDIGITSGLGMLVQGVLIVIAAVALREPATRPSRRRRPATPVVPTTAEAPLPIPASVPATGSDR